MTAETAPAATHARSAPRAPSTTASPQRAPAVQPPAPVLDVRPDRPAPAGPAAGRPVAWRLEPAEGDTGLPDIRVEAGRCLIGSGPNADLRLDVRGVSPNHCLFVVGPTKALLKPFDPKVWINGVQTDGEAVLADGDRLTVGPIDLLVRTEQAPNRADRPAAGRPLRPGPVTASRPDAVEEFALRRERLALREDRVRRARARLDRRAAAVDEARAALKRERRALRKLERRARDAAERRERELAEKLADALATENRPAPSADDAARRTARVVELNAEILSLRAETDRRLRDVESREGDLARREEALGETERLAREELTSLRTERESLRIDAKERHAADRAELGRARDQLDDYAARIERQLEGLAAATAEGLRPSAPPEESAAAHAELEARRADLEREREQLAAERAELNEVRDRVETDRATLLAERETLAAERDKIAAERAALEHESSDLADARTRLERDSLEVDAAATDESPEVTAALAAVAEREARVESRFVELDLREAAVGERESACFVKEEALVAREADLLRREEATPDAVPTPDTLPEVEPPPADGAAANEEFSLTEASAEPEELPAEELRAVSPADEADGTEDDSAEPSEFEPEPLHEDFAGIDGAAAEYAPVEASDADDEPYPADAEADLGDDESAAEEVDAPTESLRNQLAAMFDLPEDAAASPSGESVTEASAVPEEDEFGVTGVADPAEPSFADAAETEPFAAVMAEPPPVPAFEEPAATEEPAAPEEPEQPESVDDYMTRLLARMRGQSEPELPPEKAPEIAAAAVAEEEPAAVEDESAAPAADPEPLRRERPAVDHDALRAKTDSFREMANQSARAAIARHTVTKQKAAVVIKGVVTVAGAMLGVALVSTPLWLEKTFVIYGLAAFAAAGFAAYDLVDSVRTLNETMRRLEMGGGRNDEENQDQDDVATETVPTEFPEV